MCQQHPPDHQPSKSQDGTSSSSKQPFPWHLGACDAHCHPTDTMASIASIPSMRARALTIMATRSQDQHLVSSVANDLGVVRHRESLLSAHRDAPCAVIPSFGWHPWFSHQLYDDTTTTSTSTTTPPSSLTTYNPGDTTTATDEDLLAAKKAHYATVLTPSPDDQAFISSLPTPTSLSSFLSSTRSLLTSHPFALVGEIGLDKAFRLPRPWEEHHSNSRPDSAGANSLNPPSRDDTLTPGGREGRLLSPHRVRPHHQQAILSAQLRLAGDLGRPVSLHGVQAHGLLYDTVAACWKGHEREVVSRRKRRMDAAQAQGPEESDSEEDATETTEAGGKPFPPRICLHSFSGSVEVLKQWFHPSTPADIYVSFSTAINLGTDAGKSKLPEVIAEVPKDRILVESDLHRAGEDMDAALEDMYRMVCEIKGWGLEDGVRRIRENYETFIFG
ncbi:Cut9-interacting protein-like protein [Hapsidospora chrysogenum ATCC 11550]|uniref:Cut9-interacting protein-like protein n=1 Tax=Hapsidospora chrysogenum (strain ATCC 11550 / CBS 779.69 / DSM 880 / IAM 14645 / JCM 23072 / IMI 49137) TaxID=857340 RepID=A0A086T054_HAPC1|nr:Cut9-interacting protein-like protein [Hapsidospora chrysogenum ATCC 11550]